MIFDKAVFLKNVEFLMQTKQVKASEIEDLAKVSRGYYSRLKKAGNSSIPGIEFIMTASSIFGVTVETISTVDLSQCSENEYYLSSFIERLISKTETKELSWSVYSREDYTNKQENKKDEDLFFKYEKPLMEVITNQLKGKTTYNSTFKYGNYSCSGMEGDIYLCPINSESTFCIVKVLLSNKSIEQNGLELFMITNHNKRSNICCITPTKPKIYDVELRNLYNIIREQINENTIDDGTKAVIDSFMNS